MNRYYIPSEISLNISEYTGKEFTKVDLVDIIDRIKFYDPSWNIDKDLYYEQVRLEALESEYIELIQFLFHRVIPWNVTNEDETLVIEVILTESDIRHFPDKANVYILDEHSSNIFFDNNQNLRRFLSLYQMYTLRKTSSFITNESRKHRAYNGVDNNKKIHVKDYSLDELQELCSDTINDFSTLNICTMYDTIEEPDNIYVSYDMIMDINPLYNIYDTLKDKIQRHSMLRAIPNVYRSVIESINGSFDSVSVITSNSLPNIVGNIGFTKIGDRYHIVGSPDNIKIFYKFYVNYQYATSDLRVIFYN